MSTFTNSPDDWIEHAEGVEIALDTFEKYVLPIFQKRGYSREAAMIYHAAILLANEANRDDDDDSIPGLH